jgi:hypothetical protein
LVWFVWLWWLWQNHYFIKFCLTNFTIVCNMWKVFTRPTCASVFLLKISKFFVKPFNIPNFKILSIFCSWTSKYQTKVPSDLFYDGIRLIHFLILRIPSWSLNGYCFIKTNCQTKDLFYDEICWTTLICINSFSGH